MAEVNSGQVGGKVPSSIVVKESHMFFMRELLGKLHFSKTDEFLEKFQTTNEWPPPALFLEENIANFKEHVDVCAFWHRFTDKFSLNKKENLPYEFSISEWSPAGRPKDNEKDKTNRK